MKLMEISSIHNKGNGCVAKENLHPGQEILCEEAAVVGPASVESCLGKCHIFLEIPSYLLPFLLNQVAVH